MCWHKYANFVSNVYLPCRSGDGLDRAIHVGDVKSYANISTRFSFPRSYSQKLHCSGIQIVFLAHVSFSCHSSLTQKTYARTHPATGLHITRSLGHSEARDIGLSSKPDICARVMGRRDRFLIIATQGTLLAAPSNMGMVGLV